MFYSVGDAAQLIQRSAHTLRVWEKKGFCAFERDSTGRRLVREDQIPSLRRLAKDRAARIGAGRPRKVAQSG